MSLREDETARRTLYGGHPPSCTCVECTNKRLKRINRRKSLMAKWWVWLLIAIVVGIVAFVRLT